MKDGPELSFTLTGNAKTYLLDLGRETIQSMEWTILHAILRGNLARAYEIDSKVTNALNKL